MRSVPRWRLHGAAGIASRAVQSPLTVNLGAHGTMAHIILEAIAYLAGFVLMLRERRRTGDFLGEEARWVLIAAAIIGALAGSKIVHWTNELPLGAEVLGQWRFWLEGKSIVGGLIGGTLAVELAKRRLGITRRTGDVSVLPLCASIAIGRVGCFLAGLQDQTHGVPTNLPWAVDFGDGIARHPTQLYEALAVLGLAGWLVRSRPRLAEGVLFQRFLLSYLALRVGLDFLKPYSHGLGMSGTQWWALAGIVAECCWVSVRSRAFAGVSR